MNFISGLNNLQLKAVAAEGVTVINAGPGTGKTKTLAARIVYLITQKNINPSHILALTFTKKAVSEMRDRLQEYDVGTLPYIATFHALSYDILKDIYGDIEIFEDPKDMNQNAANQFTYDDLIEKTAELLKSKDLKIQSWKVRFSHILVDELQDTNELQYEIVKKLLPTPGVGNIFMIGDPRQSIYSFRGADASIFEKVQKDFQSTRVIILNKNYRSGQNIIDVSQKLFPKATSLQSMSNLKGTAQHIITHNEKTESKWIINNIQDHIGGADLLQASDLQKENIICRFSDFAVIYRTHMIGGALERWFREDNVPYQVIGGNSLFERPHIRIITEAMKELLFEDESTGKVSDVIQMIIESTKVEQLIKKSKNKQKDLQQFLSIMFQFNQHKDGLFQAVKYITYLEEHEYYDEYADRVTLMTIHAAKGLEFDHVYIAGFEDGVIPLKREGVDFDEEKRLLYVAMTRAKKTLSLIQPKYRLGQHTKASPFFDLLENSQMKQKTDKAIAVREKQQKKWFEKKAQIKMF